MAVSIRVAHLKLVNVDSVGNVFDKDSHNITLDDIRRSASKEYRIIRNGTGFAESPNAIEC